MGSIAEELKRKISDRKRAIESLGHSKKTITDKTISNPDMELLQVAMENTAVASGVVMQDGYSLILSGKSGFFGKIVIFLKRAIRKVIHVCLGFYIKPILNRQTIFNGKTLNAVTSIQDWCFSKQSEIEQLHERLTQLEKDANSAQEENRKMLTKAEEQAYILWQEKCNVEVANASLREVLKEKEKEIAFLQRKLEEIESTNSKLESDTKEIKGNVVTCSLEVKKQKVEITKLQTELPNIETKLLDKFENGEKAIHKLNCKMGQTTKDVLEMNQQLQVQGSEVNQLSARFSEAQQETEKTLNYIESIVNESKEIFSKCDLELKKQNDETKELRYLTDQTSKEVSDMAQKIHEQNREVNLLNTYFNKVQKEAKKDLNNIGFIANESKERISKCELELKKQKDEIQEIRCLTAQTEKVALDNATAVTSINERVTEIAENGLKELKDNAGILTHLRDKFGLYYDLNLLNDSTVDYFDFENHFRGATEETKNSQRPYLKYFSEGDRTATIVDLGCGRGEFLELLTENGFDAVGVDVYQPFIEHCRNNGLQIIQSDALTYLNQLPDESLGGIFMGQVLEHLSSEYLVSVVRCIYRKLKKGSYFIAETPNPETLSTYCNFYLDLEHMKPVHYLTMEYFLKDAGFSEVSRYNNEFSRYPFDLQTNERMSEQDEMETWRLNNILFGYRDYTVIAKK